jgi:thiamine pyrophosphate-dependent acetolactate synthase large subunit-like protein
MKAADVLGEELIDWGVDVVFGLPGDGINGIMESLRTHQEKIRFIQVRHEEAAAFMACGYAKFTGKLGVCLATSGPGGIHLLNGLYDAKLDGQPVLAITGLQFHDLIGTYTQQDVALDQLFVDVAVFNERIMGPTHVENIAALACRMALACKKVAILAGRGALKASDELEHTAELLAAPIVMALLGKAAVPDVVPILLAASVCSAPDPLRKPWKTATLYS